MELSTLPTWAHQRGDLNQALEQLGNILGDLCDAPASSDTQCRAVTCILDHASSRFWRAFHALKKRKQDDCLNVAVLALTKSGKSTLLNALVGAELLPMNNVPETARICKVVHTVGQEPFLMEPVTDGQGSGGANRSQASKQQITVRGEAAVRERLHELNQAARERSFSSSSIRSRAPSTPLGPNSSQGQHLHTTGSLPSALEGLSAIQTRTSGSGPDAIDEEAEEQPAGLAATSSSGTPPAAATGMPTDNMLSIHAPVAALLEYAPTTSNQAPSNGQDTPLSGVRLQLLDTPGPNEAGEEDLRHQVERLLDGVDVALYLLDYTKLKTQDEAGMFERLKVVNPALVKRLSQRLFFVVNKVDAAQTSEGQDLESTRLYVAELVTRQMGLDGFHLQPEQVLLLSARNALLSRLILRGTATPESKARFAQLAFGRFASPASIPQESWVAAAHALLADSGLLDLEAQVLAYLYTHAAAVKHLAVVDDLGRLLVEVRNVTTSCAAALSASAEALSHRVTEVRDQLTTTLAQFEAVQQDADAIGKEVAKEVNANLHTLRGRLFSAIINALDTSNASIAAPPGSMARRWQGVRERFLSIFTGRGSGGVFSSQSSNISAGPLPGAAGVAYYSADGSVAGDVVPSGEAFDTAALLNAAGGAVARSRSRAELSALLVALHEDLTAQIHAEVREFWSVMEAVAAARHAELLTTLNTHLSQLSKQVESAVSRSLEIRLNPVSLSLAPPDASQFHADLNELLSRGLVETRERHIRVNQKQVTEQVLRKGGGICRWGDYWESVPRMRTVVEAYTLSVYEVVPSEITAHFISMVDSAVDATQTSLESYVSQFVGQQLEEARQQLQEYSNSYLGVMSGALDVTHKGSEQRMAALGQVLSLLTRLDDVQTRYDSLQSATEGAVPRAQEAIAYDDLGDIIEDSEHISDQEDDQADNRAAPVQDAAVPQQEIFMSPSTVMEHAEGQAAAVAGQVEGPGGSTPAVGDVNAAAVGDAAGDTGLNAKAPCVPGSPMSVGSSTVNAMLRQPITALAASAATGTAASRIAAHATPVEPDPEPSTLAAAGVVPSAAIFLSPFAPRAAVAVEEGHAGMADAPAGDKEARDAALDKDMPTLDAHTATLDVPFDYAKAMSCHLEAVSSSEGVCMASRGDEGVSDVAEGTDEWDLVDAEEEEADEKARQPVLA